MEHIWCQLFQFWREQELSVQNVEHREEIVLPFIISGNAHSSLLSTYFVMIYIIDTAITTTDTGFRMATLLLGNGKYNGCYYTL